MPTHAMACAAPRAWPPGPGAALAKAERCVGKDDRIFRGNHSPRPPDSRRGRALSRARAGKPTGTGKSRLRASTPNFEGGPGELFKCFPPGRRASLPRTMPGPRRPRRPAGQDHGRDEFAAHAVRSSSTLRPAATAPTIRGRPTSTASAPRPGAERVPARAPPRRRPGSGPAPGRAAISGRDLGAHGVCSRIAAAVVGDHDAAATRGWPSRRPPRSSRP